MTGGTDEAPAPGRSTRILLVRHGETPYNASGRCQGHLDAAMSARGEMQVARLRHRLVSQGDLEGLRAVYTSPLSRARRTAQMLASDTTLVIVDDDDLLELSYGAYQGSAPHEWPASLRRQWRHDPWSVTFPDGESLAAVRTRALAALHRIVSAHPGESVMVSAHGHVNRLILLDALGLPLGHFRAIRQPNADAWWVECALNDDGQLRWLSATRAETAVTLELARRAIDSKTKPLGALGALEECAVRLAMLQQTLTPRIGDARICVFGADHGIAAEGVSAYPRAVTAEMMRNFARGGAAINVLARTNDVEVEVIDVGVDADLSAWPDIHHAKVRGGSRNLLHEAALSPEELDAACAVGAAAVQRAVRDGMDVIGLGEMGIGNTTAAAALLSALTGQPSTLTAGAGTGVQGSALAHKRAVVDRALALHGGRAALGSARECLRHFGGLELAAMAGATLEAMTHPIVVLADGFISTVAVLAAVSIAGESKESPETSPDGVARLFERIFLSHRSTEIGHAIAIEALVASGGGSIGLRPLLDLDMRLGEGTGAVLTVPLLRSAAAIMSDMATFDEAGVSAGEQRDAHQVVRP